MKKLLLIILSLTLFLGCNKDDDIADNTITRTVTDYDGNVYSTVKIGEQCWMRENLKTTHFANGVAIPIVEGENSWGALDRVDKAYCYSQNTTSNANTYGALYNWAAAMNGELSSDENPSGVQGVCPDGWHLPSDNEWKELEMYLGMSQVDADGTGNRGTNEGSKLAGNANLWTDGDLINDSAFDTYGFIALPGGGRAGFGHFDGLSNYTAFWSATESGYMDATMRFLHYHESDVVRHFWPRKSGVSVRCVKDN